MERQAAEPEILWKIVEGRVEEEIRERLEVLGQHLAIEQGVQ